MMQNSTRAWSESIAIPTTFIFNSTLSVPRDYTFSLQNCYTFISS